MIYSLRLSSRNEILISIFIVAMAFSLSFGIFVFSTVHAQSPEDNIKFPIAELGGCANQRECKAYCDSLDHINECVNFAESNGLMSTEEARVARSFAKSGGEGPGGCSDRNSCDAFCEDINNIDECLAFAEQHDILPGAELDEAKKVAKALREGAELPGGCKNKRECEAYCENGDNIEECLAFAEKAGFLPPEELAQARKFSQFMKRGETPGGCRGERECRRYCEEDSNFKECGEFAIKAGLVSPREAEMIRKTGGRGPGNCKSKESCEAFCQKPANSQTCFEFAKKHGIIDERQLQEAEQGMGRLKDALNGAPEGVISCIDAKIGAERLDGILAGQIVPSPDLARVVEGCFREGFGAGPDESRRGGPRPEDGDFGGDFGPDGFDGDREGGPRGGPQGGFGGFLDSAPPKVIECVKSKGGADIERALRGERTEIDLQVLVGRCFEEFGPEERGGDEEHDGDFDDDFERPERLEGSEFDRENFRPDDFSGEFPEGVSPDDFERRFEDEFNRQFDEEVDRQFQEESQRRSGEFQKEFLDGQSGGGFDGIPQNGLEGEVRIFDDPNREVPQFNPSATDLERQRIEEETRRQIEGETRNQIESQFNQTPPPSFDGGFNGGFDGGVQPPTNFPSPSDFSPENPPSPSSFAPKNLRQRAASLLPFIRRP